MFSNRLETFIKSIRETPTSFETLISATKGSIYKPIKNGKTVGVEILEKIVSNYPQLNLEWLITGAGEMLKDSTKSGSKIENVHLISTPNSTPNSKSKKLGVQNIANPYLPYNSELTKEVIMTKHEAAAGISGILSGDDKDHIKINLPATMLGWGSKFLGFKVRNDSMHPTLYDGDWVIGRFIDPGEWQEVKNEHIYVISTKTDGIKIKRVRNRLKEVGFLRCKSDNKTVPSFNVESEDIASLFEVRCRISFNFPNEPAIMQEQIRRLEDRLDDIQGKNKTL
ncbi:S24 family peptidase [Dyadobacter frigoris]|uniref:LexA family transcriptional regulator n=1 Tax=Dyadobacter frigoris TaxID=2576211 RepID=A0A4U6D159_9BACT|nr:LexA family transcriptional regulator [Dyadobacter frigoris]TKT89508.1 LexA family transcriptional regulator [Dyadobacter frigoris]